LRAHIDSEFELGRKEVCDAKSADARIGKIFGQRSDRPAFRFRGFASTHELQNQLKLLSAIIPSVIVANGMSRKISCAPQFAACGVRQDMVSLQSSLLSMRPPRMWQRLPVLRSTSPRFAFVSLARGTRSLTA
jgi:hypothetical protein